MQKAYDIKELGLKIHAKAKAKGLDIAEEAVEMLAVAAYEATKDWAKESAVISENKIDDVIAPFYDHMDGMVLPQIAKIDLDHDGD
jgi:hypothetical protein